MLKPYHNQLNTLVFVYAHTGWLEDEGNRIYSISSTIVRPGNSPLEFKSHVQYKKFTERERYYSRLSKKELELAPNPKEVKNQIKTFLQGQGVAFAFNNNSDLNELKKISGINRIVDLSFASEFFLQHLESHSLKRLWEYLFRKRRDRVSFSASEIVLLSIEVVKHICGTELSDQKYHRARALRYYLKMSDTLFSEIFIHITRNFRDYFGGLFNPYSMPDTEDWKAFLERVNSSTLSIKKDKPHRKISLEEINDRYQKMAEAGRGYKLRSSQVKYASSITSALNNKSILCIEAGTGTGKTQGYLIPVMEFLRKNPDERVAISTYTKSLQEQIYQREIALTKGLFKIYADIPVALLKGKSSYICAEKLDDFYEERFKGVHLLIWIFLLNNVYSFRKADVDTVGENVKKYLDKEKILTHALRTISAKEGCISKHNRCPAQVLTAQARDSQLIVTNHHKLAFLDTEPILSGLFRNYIIDEANHFEDAVRNAFRTEANSNEISRSLLYLKESIGKIYSKATGVKEKALKQSLTGIATLTSCINELRSALISINPHLKIMEESIIIPGHANFIEGHINTHLQKIRETVLDINNGVNAFSDEDSKRMLKIVPKTAKKMQVEMGLINGFAESLKQIENSLTSQNSVPSYILLRKNLILFASPVEVDEIIRKNIYEDRDCIVYTAATLSQNRSFNCFQEITGLTKSFDIVDESDFEKRIESIAIPSPFSSDLMELIVPGDAISGRYDNKEAWLNSIVPMIFDLVNSNKGRTLVLFSSYEDLKHVAEKVSDDINNSGYPLLIQKPGSPTINLCDEFRTVKESVLFGVDTFWYGVDFMGDTLTQVIITRIPYPSPKDPIQMMRKQILPGKKYWERFYYEKDIKLKQGIGRLIRSETDRGKVFILDSRFKAKDFLIKEKVYPVISEDKCHGVTNDDGYNFRDVDVRSDGVVEKSQIFPDNDLDITGISNLNFENIAAHHNNKDSASNNYSDYLSTTALAKRYGINQKILYDYFVKIGWTEKKGNDRKLSELGKKYGGKYKTLNKKHFWIVWPSNILKDEIFKELISKNITEQAEDEDETYSTIKKYKDDAHAEHETDESDIGKWPLKKTNDEISDQKIIEIRKKYRRAYESWSDREDNLLRQQFKENKSIKYLAEIFQRNPGAIRSRIKKLGIKEQNVLVDTEDTKAKAYKKKESKISIGIIVKRKS
jgi:ATP-dependent DNA helicase DinG